MSVLRAPIIALAALGFAGAAAAETIDPTPPSIEALVVVAPTSVVDEALVSDTDLAGLAGGAEPIVASEQTLTAVNAGNAVNADVVNNGPVTLHANAFTGFAGIGNFVINTGNNNNLQGSLSVNIVMTPGS